MSTASVSQALSLSRPRWHETAALMLAAWLVPVLVHLIPWSGERPLGVYLLPVFWTAFVAVYWQGPARGLLVALFNPALNLLITGLPALERLGTMGLELAGFVAVTALLLYRWPRFVLAAPLAYLPAKAFAILVQWAVPAFNYHRDPIAHLRDSVVNGLAGLAVLLALNLLLVRIAPKGERS